MKSSHLKKAVKKPDTRILVVNKVTNVEESQKPFGKRWRQEEMILTPAHLAALRRGKRLALDVQGEYVVFLKLDPTVPSHRKRTSLDAKRP